MVKNSFMTLMIFLFLTLSTLNNPIGTKTVEHSLRRNMGLAAQELEKKIIEIGIERVAAFIGEPIQGAGGGDRSS